MPMKCFRTCYKTQTTTLSYKTLPYDTKQFLSMTKIYLSKTVKILYNSIVVIKYKIYDIANNPQRTSLSK